jgi:hypothetical protein
VITAKRRYKSVSFSQSICTAPTNPIVNLLGIITKSAELKEIDLKMKGLPDKKYLNECFNYETDTGHLFWKVRPIHHFNTSRGMNIANSMYSYKKAGALSPDGYIYLKIAGVCYLAHRIIWCMINGEFPPDQVDHIDHCRSNNHIENLRLATNQENHRNRSISSNNKSGTTGVTWHKRDRSWRAQIQIDGKSTTLGTFKDKSEAIKVREAANIKYGYHPNHGCKGEM